MRRFLPAALAMCLAASLLSPAAAQERGGPGVDERRADTTTGPDRARRNVLNNLIGHPRHHGRVLWYDLSANFDSLDTPAKVADIVDKTADAGFDTIVLDVGNYTGFVAYHSDIAPHIGTSQVYAGRAYDPDYDLLAEVLDAAHARGLEVHANLNVFAQGATGVQEGPAYDHPQWQSVFYEGRRLATTADGASFRLAGTDVERGANQLVLYTPDRYEESPANQWGAEAALVDGVVTELRDRTVGAPPLAVPEDGVVLAAHGTARTWLLANAQPGTTIDLTQTETRLVPAAEHEAQFATFVNPLRDDVRAYAQSLFTELVENYDLDGVVLDRARYASQYADFSDDSRAAFEDRIGQTVTTWPEDVFEIVFDDAGEQDIVRGPLFAEWLEFRAAVIQDFVDDTSNMVRDLDPSVRFSIYAGAWYPLYWHEGVNWGSRNYQPDDLDWASENYGSTGYAESLDFFMAGTYFEDVTREEAVASDRPEDWYSVEGSAELAMEAVDLATFVYGSLFVLQYEDDEDRFRRAMEMALERTHGLMVFDLVYLDQYDWWHVVADVLDGPAASPHTNPGFLNLVRR